jgi:hypothetical protein
VGVLLVGTEPDAVVAHIHFGPDAHRCTIQRYIWWVPISCSYSPPSSCTTLVFIRSTVQGISEEWKGRGQEKPSEVCFVHSESLLLVAVISGYMYCTSRGPFHRELAML